MCGEKSINQYKDLSTLGSPPRVRGEEQWAQRASPVFRITPACAGRSVDRVVQLELREDHPRVCGEKCFS